MQKLILIIILITISISAKFEKENKNNSKFNSGLKLGISLSKTQGNSESNVLHSKFGFETGVFSSYKINNIISFQPELLFTQKGYIVKGDITKSSYHYTFNYLQIPLLVSFKIVPKIKLYLGGYASYFINAWISASSVSSETLKEKEKILERTINNFNAGLISGIVFKGNNNLLFDFRFERGLTTVYNIGSLDYYNQSFKVSIAWLF